MDSSIHPLSWKATSDRDGRRGARCCFLYRVILEDPLPWLDDLVWAQRPLRVLVVLTIDEVRAVLHEIGVCRIWWCCFCMARVYACWRV